MTAPERIRVVVTDAEVIGPFPAGDDRATDFVREDLYTTLAAENEAVQARAARAEEYFLASEERVQAYMDGTNEARISQSQVRFRAARNAMLTAMKRTDTREGETK